MNYDKLRYNYCLELFINYYLAVNHKYKMSKFVQEQCIKWFFNINVKYLRANYLQI
jgi:hypothetical protein